MFDKSSEDTDEFVPLLALILMLGSVDIFIKLVNGISYLAIANVME